MNNLASDTRNREHTLSDWLDLHELDPETCHDMLNAIAGEIPEDPAVLAIRKSGYRPPALEAAWSRVAAALRAFLSGQRNVVDDTFENTTKILVDRPDKSRKALTLDNGPSAYPTILYSYGGEPSDFLVIAHEFGHALQIQASGGKFVPPITREICAFLGESALLAYSRRRDTAEYACLAQAWRDDNFRYFGIQRTRLRKSLRHLDEPYKYSWNYPIARYLTIRVLESCSQDMIWDIFQGGVSIREILGGITATAAAKAMSASDAMPVRKGSPSPGMMR